jgi:proteasome lid subunit RPN8/RPN11
VSNLNHIQRIVVPASALHHAHDFMRKVGELGYEGLALLVGRSSGQAFEVTDVWVPRQRVHQSEQGIGVVVDANELHRINVALYSERLEVAGQIHSHPTNAYHSDTDDDFAIANTVGAISIVVPDFATRAFRLDDCAVYRLALTGEWVELSVEAVMRLIEIDLDAR